MLVGAPAAHLGPFPESGLSASPWLGVTPVRYGLTLAILAIPQFIVAAPRLPDKPGFNSVAAKGKYALVDDYACEQFTVNFSIRGKKATTYTVELYVEGNGTGERAVLVQTISVKTDDVQHQADGFACDLIRAGTPSSGIPGPAFLPNVGKGEGWSYCLVLKEGNAIVADTGFSWVRYAGKPE